MCHEKERPGPESETHLRPAVFEQLRLAMNSDPSGFLELYRDYLAEAWLSVQALRVSIQQRDAEAVRAKAHYLKSSSMVLGAAHVAQEAAILEEAAAGGRFDEAAARLNQAVLRLKQVTARLVEELGREVDPAGITAA